jgi:hypothetical protein
MLGKRVKELEAVATRLEAITARLERHDGLAVAELVLAVDECLSIIFGPVAAALIAGDHDRARLVRVATAPLIRALGATPPAQQLSATRTALWNIVSLLVGRLAVLRQEAAGPSAPLAS